MIESLLSRYSVVDEERGLTFGTFMFHHAGTVKSVEVHGVGEVEMIPAAGRLFTVVVSKLFEIKKDKICEINENDVLFNGFNPGNTKKVTKQTLCCQF